MIQLIKKLLGGRKTDFAALVRDGALLVDVRSASEFRAGHLPGSRNIPLDSIRSKTDELKKLNKPVITVCRSGARSGMAKGILKAAGLEVYNGGAWISLKNKLS